MKRCTTNGKEPELPEDKQQGAPGPVDPLTGQHTQYWILCQEERDKGFVRPLRRSYIHKGRKLRGELEYLPKPMESDYTKKTYVALDRFRLDDGTKAGTYLTQTEVDSILKTGYYRGCDVETHMGLALCETYARDPKFYSSTFCCGCKKHLPVHEFVWAEDEEVVGS